MKLAKIIIGGVMVVAACAGLYALIKSPGAASSGGDDDDAVVAPGEPGIVSVQTGILQRATLHQMIAAYGTVEAAPATAAAPAADAPLAAPTAGVVARVNVVEGQAVNQGDVLMELNSGTATYQYAQAEWKRQKQLYAEHNTSLKALEDAETQVALLRVVSPLSGTVTRLNVKPGAAVDATTVVAEVMDLSRLAVSLGIPEADAASVKPGDEVQVLAQPPVTATLTYMSPAVDANNDTIAAWATVPADSGLRPGQFVSLQLVTATHTNCLTAPDVSVVTDDTGSSRIALVTGDSTNLTAVQTTVQTGFRENGRVEISGDGLKEGQAVVTVGAYALPDKAKIQIVNETNPVPAGAPMESPPMN
jgi:multidrug efflux pump subunit AcrA (membrane-fusion protein)